MKDVVGIAHIALYTVAFEDCVHFYTQKLGMKVVWRPDADNVYLSSGRDNLALHRTGNSFAQGQMHLDHFGFILKTPEAVDDLYEQLINNEVTCLMAPKTHRDNSRSFYCEDPDGNRLQFIYIPEDMFPQI